MLLFAVRKAFLESVGFSPFELVCGYSMCGGFLCENAVISILYDVGYFRYKFTRACEIDTLKQNS
jgi:hypothetical protein